MALAGTWRLVRLVMRRERIRVSVWLVALGGLTAGVVSGVSSVYGTAAERAAGAAFIAANVPTRAFSGPASGTEPGAMAVVEAYLVLAVLVAVMGIQMVVRHTRADEETGRAELLGSAVVGRHARMAAALIVTIGASLAVGGVIAGVLVADGFAVAGAVAAGGALSGVGITFAAVAAVTAQVFSGGRAATASAAGVLGAAFLLRAVGDAAGDVTGGGVEVTSAWPSWLSPLGWGQQMRPFHQDNWEVLGLFAGLTVVLVAVACWLTAHRDVGAGIVAVPPGPPEAPATLRGTLGLAWRLQRSTLLGWVVGLAIIGAAFGAIGDSADDLSGISEELERAMTQMAPEGGMVDLYIAFTMGFLGVAATAFCVQALLRMRGEEAGGRLEPVLAGAVSRTRWLASNVAIALGGTVVLLAVTGAAGALAHGAVTGDWSTGSGHVGAALAQVPAAVALGGAVVMAFAVVPRWSTAIGWGVLATALVMGQLGALLELPQAVLNISPFTHVPAVPAEVFVWTPTVWLLVTALAMGTAGAVAFSRRDLAIGA